MFLMDITKNNSEDKLKKLISKSKLEIPFSDFEERVMQSIKKEVDNQKVINRNIRLSWLFFTLGTAFGLLLSVILSPVSTILGFPVSKLILPVYITGGTLLLLFVEQLLKLTLIHRRHQ